MPNTTEEIEARRAQRKVDRAAARAAQYDIDIVHIDELEAELGDDRVAVLTMPSFVPDLPTVVVVKSPTEPLIKRFRQQVRKAGPKYDLIGAARDMLAHECIAYPEKDVYAKMIEQWPSVHDAVGVKAVELGEAEGKD